MKRIEAIIVHFGKTRIVMTDPAEAAARMAEELQREGHRRTARLRSGNRIPTPPVVQLIKAQNGLHKRTTPFERKRRRQSRRMIARQSPVPVAIRAKVRSGCLLKAPPPPPALLQNQLLLPRAMKSKVGPSTLSGVTEHSRRNMQSHLRNLHNQPLKHPLSAK